jgi:dienelactone hydrolase
LAILALLLVLGGCGKDGTPPTAPGPVVPLPSTIEFFLSGNPESGQGATWIYRGAADGVTYDLQGILMKPPGDGPFPAVVVSHGAGGSVSSYSRAVAAEMRTWGLVAIATNYTHAGGVPTGAPGTVVDLGASPANVLRARAAVTILRSLGYVDAARVAAHGHSMGAFVTMALAAARPADLRVASHTAGGVRPDTVPGFAPTEGSVRSIRAPYQWHHGTDDVVVLIQSDQRFDAILQEIGVPREGHVYPGASHADVSGSAQMFARTREWYARHGMF